MLEAGSRGSTRRAPAASSSSTAHNGEWAVAGERVPASSPITRRARAPWSSATTRASCCSNSGSTWRDASGSATQSCTPCSAPVCASGVSSEWAMPRPDVIRLSTPGRPTPVAPVLSRWRISPASSHETVCSPMCGCGATSIGLPEANERGPKPSRKHQGPIIRRPRVGSRRRIGSPIRSLARPGSGSGRAPDAGSALHGSTGPGFETSLKRSSPTPPRPGASRPATRRGPARTFGS